MSFADPQSVTVDAITHSLVRTSSGVNAGQFRLKDSTDPSGKLITWTLSTSSQYGKRTRRVIRLDRDWNESSIVGPTGVNVGRTLSAYLVVDSDPLSSMTVSDEKKFVEGLTALLAASSGAALLKLLGGEN